MRDDVNSIQVSIIIINYNSCKMTQECIESVINHTKNILYEIILIDNNSKDGSKEHFESDQRIRYIYSFENLGFGRANNLGMILAKGEYVFLLNNDTLLLNNAVKQLYDYAKSCEGVSAFYGGWLLDAEKKHIHSFSEIITMGSLLKGALQTYIHFFKKKESPLLSEYSLSGNAVEVGYITGADMFFHRSIFEKHGGFDHHFFMYYEECDWQWRMKQYGIKSIVIKGPEIIHLCGQPIGSPQKVRNIRVKLMNLESLKYYLKKHYSIFQYVLFRPTYFILKAIPTLVDRRYYSLSDRLKYLLALVL